MPTLHDYLVDRLEASSGDRDITCPYCNQGYDVYWNTEYGDPPSVRIKITCPKCGSVFNVAAVTHYNCWKQEKDYE